MKAILSKYTQPFQQNLLRIVTESEELDLHSLYGAKWYQYHDADLDTNELIFMSSQFSDETFRIPASKEDTFRAMRDLEGTYLFFRELKYAYLETL